MTHTDDTCSTICRVASMPLSRKLRLEFPPMKRETRANLVFIAVFLCLTIPGAVILFRKKMDPAAPPMFMPDFVRRRLPYMASQLSPEMVTRYVPDLTGRWVSELSKQRAGTSQILMAGREPLMSEDHLIQLVAMQQNGADNTTLHFIVWDPACTSDPNRYTITPSAHITSAISIPMPLPVKKELMNAGVIEPPNAITWLTADVAGVPKRVDISYQPENDPKPIIRTIPIPTTGD